MTLILRQGRSERKPIRYRSLASSRFAGDSSYGALKEQVSWKVAITWSLGVVASHICLIASVRRLKPPYS
jgi:hypothetical protein